MLGIGFGEMILIAGIALIVFGPEKFPDFAKIVLRTVNDLRGYVDDIQQEVTKEIRPIKREIEQMSKYNPEKYIDSLSKDITKTDKKSEKTESESDEPDNDAGEFSEDSEDSAPTSDDAPYMESDTSADISEEGYETVENTMETGKNQDDQAVDNREEPDDDLDFSTPPVERID